MECKINRSNEYINRVEMTAFCNNVITVKVLRQNYSYKITINKVSKIRTVIIYSLDFEVQIIYVNVPIVERRKKFSGSVIFWY